MLSPWLAQREVPHPHAAVIVPAHLTSACARKVPGIAEGRQAAIHRRAEEVDASSLETALIW